MIHNLENRAFIGVLVLVSLSFIWLLSPFFSAIFWAALLAILFTPMHRRLQQRFPGKDTRNALLALVASFLLVVVPLSLVLILVTLQSVNLYQELTSGDPVLQPFLEPLKQQFPAINDWLASLSLDWNQVREIVLEVLQSSGQVLARSAFQFGQGYVHFLLNLVLMLYLIFYFLRDGSRLTRLMIRALPLGDQREERLFRKFAEVCRATVKGSLVVAMVQGTLGGLAFWVLGIEGAILWGTLMVILSLLPAVGSALVWAPAAGWLFLQGHPVSAIVLTLFGVFVIGLVDNVLRPILVGRDTQMPDYLVLLSTLGGIGLFGLSGFIMGPVLAALFLVIWQIFMEEYQDNALR